MSLSPSLVIFGNFSSSLCCHVLQTGFGTWM